MKRKKYRHQWDCDVMGYQYCRKCGRWNVNDPFRKRGRQVQKAAEVKGEEAMNDTEIRAAMDRQYETAATIDALCRDLLAAREALSVIRFQASVAHGMNPVVDNIWNKANAALGEEVKP